MHVGESRLLDWGRLRLRLLRRPVISALVVALGALALAGCGDEEEIVIGTVFSFSEAGQGYGQQQLRGAELAIEQINEAGGIEGVPLRLVQAEGTSDEAAEMEAATRRLLEEESVVALMGPTFSNNAPDVHPIANEAETPVLTVSNTAPGIVGNCAYPCDNVYRVSLGEATAIPANVRSLAADEIAPGDSVVIHPAEDNFGATTADMAAEALTDAGHPASINTVDGLADTWPAQVEDIIERDTAVVFITASSAQAAADLIVAVDDSGYDGPVLGGNAFNGSAVAEMAGEAGTGARSASAWSVHNPMNANRNFVDAYTIANGEPPDQFAAQAFTGVLVLAEAMRKSGADFGNVVATRRAIAQHLVDVHIDTPLGQFSFTPDHDVAQPIWLLEMDGFGGHELLGETPSA